MHRRAVYAGSFDPPTSGHFDVLKKLAPLFETIHVVVAHNNRKQTLFTPAERVQLVEDGLHELGLNSKIVVQAHDGLVADFARAQGAKYLIRGLRALSDYENELQISAMNRKLNPELETLLVMADEQHFFISSSMAKEIARHGGPLHDLVPNSVEVALRKKISQEGGAKQ